MKITNMQDINSIILPEISSSKTKPKKSNTTVLVEKESLSKTNHIIVCNYCGSDKILNPVQYQNLFDTHESEEKLKEQFMCKPCEMNMRKNPFEFYTIHGEQFETLSKNLRNVFDAYRNSTRNPNDGVVLQDTAVSILRECKIIEPNFEFIIDNRVPVAMKIKNVPFVGTVILRVYEPRKSRIYVTE